MAQDDSYDNLPPDQFIEAEKVEEQPLRPGSAMAKPKNGTGGAAGKKVVRFNLQEEEEDQEDRNSGDDSGAGVLRIKVVISQKELKEILKNRENNSCSLEELIEELKVKGRATTVSDEIGSWKPALECIPEGEGDLHK